MKMIKYLFLFFIFSVSLTAQEYQLKLNAVFEKNQKFKLEVKADVVDEVKISIEGSPDKLKNSKVSIECLAKVEVLEVNENGTVSKAKINFELFKENNIDKFKTPTEVIVERDDKDKVVYLINNESVSAELSVSLNNVFSIKSSKAPTYQEMFGPGKTVKVGEEWSVNQEMFLKSLSEQKLEASSNLKLSGKFKLNSVEKKNNVDQMNVSGALNVSGFEMPALGKLKYEKSEITFKTAGVYAANTSKIILEESEDFGFDLIGNSESLTKEKNVKTTLNIHKTRKTKRKYIYE